VSRPAWTASRLLALGGAAALLSRLLALRVVDATVAQPPGTPPLLLGAPQAPPTSPRVADPPAAGLEAPLAPRPDPAARWEGPIEGFHHQSVAVIGGRARFAYWALTLLWAAVGANFWVWWLGHSAHSTPWLYWAQTVTLAYLTTALPTFYWFFVRRMRRPTEPPAPAHMRVAMITLCVPAHESLQVIAGQLRALTAVRYPHDSWVLDEGASADVRALAQEVGVNYFSRSGIARWNQPGPPLQAKTKAGNVNAWLAHVEELGLDYDVFVQLDIDHRPRNDYLDRVLGYFREREIAWVQAPSVCGNLESWAARGLAEQDMIFQGPLQMGFYGHTGTPFIIGSHTSYRTAAIREIGGFQPTRAEDHLDTVVLAAAGYRGVFVPELIAVGDGPHNFATYVRQQFAWAHSMIQILAHWTPRLVARYTPAQAFQFLMAQSWYTMWSLSLGVLWIIPALALFTDRRIADVNVGQYAIHFLAIPLTSSVMWCWTRRWFQPLELRLSWRGVVLEIARWPVVLWALVNVILRIKRPYMITPKGKPGQRGPSGLALYGPYAALTALSLAAVWTLHRRAVHGAIEGYYLLALSNALLSLAVVATTLTLEVRHLIVDLGSHSAAVGRRIGILSLSVALAAALTYCTIEVWGPMLHVLR
jgi:cellulose synthase (UDP-forming)